VRRREFVAFVGAAAACPFVARAQQRDRTPLIGVPMGFAESDPTAQLMVAVSGSKIIVRTR
jgi:putative tryptophan/tyrosine transport system substrate-binding protein